MRLITTLAATAIFAIVAVAASPITASAAEVIWGM
jgi:hypothetical protein